MSLRNYRKVYGAMTIPPPDGSSEEEYEPLYVKNSSKSKYAGLALSTSSESANESPKEEDVEEVEAELTKKKKKLKKIKKKNKFKHAPRTSTETFEMDEIDRSLLEINALLGEPPQKVDSPVRVKANPMHVLFTVRYKHLNVNYELERIFGPDSEEEESFKKRDREVNLRRAQRGNIIPKEYIFNRRGISMSINRREGIYTYFTFDHSRDYRRQHKSFLLVLLRRDRNMIQNVEQSIIMHVEELLEEADFTFALEDYTNANTLVEQLLAYMQHCTIPSFNLTNVTTRLEYKFVENRPFHILLLKYLYLLTNKACHRTALELAKLLINLDPTDPLAVLFIIDTLALRAREHQWLIETIDYLTLEKDAGYMFNAQYSYAMANFHVIRKKKGDIQVADALLKKCMLKYPSFVMDLLTEAKQKVSDRIKSSVLFNTFANSSTTKSLKEIINFYATLSCSKWREPEVMEWFLKNANEIADEYEAEIKLKEEADTYSAIRNTLFRGWPQEVLRHMSIIKPMASLLFDKPFLDLPPTPSFDPVPPYTSVDRYGYNTVLDEPPQLSNSILGDFISSMFPDYNLTQQNNDNNFHPGLLPVLDVNNIQERALEARRQEMEDENGSSEDDDLDVGVINVPMSIRSAARFFSQIFQSINRRRNQADGNESDED